MNAQPTTEHADAELPDGQPDALLPAIADNFATSPRSPVLHTRG